MSRVYLDHNARTDLRPEVRELWMGYLDEGLGNASGLHASGRRARHVLDEARERVAAALGVGEDGVVFTSGGTESNNAALAGVLGHGSDTARAGLATTRIEHSSVIEAAERLERQGHPLHWIEVDREGLPDVDAVARLRGRGGVRLVSVMAANNEVGSLAPLGEIAAALGDPGEPGRPLLHTDAVQALGRVPLDVRGMGIDLLSLSAHKLGGPMGVGVLALARAMPLAPWIVGGAQESGRRAGTENVPAIAAAALAIELAVAERDAHARRLTEMTAALERDVLALDGRAERVGPPVAARLPGTLTVVFPDVDGKVMVTRLDLEGLEVSAGSACASGSLEPSHVLRAMGYDERAARAGLRLSLGRTTTWSDVREAVDILGRTIGRPHTTPGSGAGL